MQNLIITNAGQSLLTSVLSEKGMISFAKAVSSTDTFELSTISELTELTNCKQTVALTSVERYSNTQTEIVIDFLGVDAVAGYYVKSVGLYASDGMKEVLFAVANEDNNVYINGSDSIVPSKAHYKFYLSISNGELISSTAPTYASTEQVLKRYKNAGRFTSGKNYYQNDVFDYDNQKCLVETPFKSGSVPDFSKVYILARRGYDHFTIDLDFRSNLNPTKENEAIRYSGGCEGFTQQDWVEWLGYAPCIMTGQGGIECHLDHSDYSRNTNGEFVDITTVTPGRNVMIMFPRIGTRVFYDFVQGKGKILITNDKDACGYAYQAFDNGFRKSSRFFIGAYPAYVDNGKMYSLSGKIQSTSGSLATYRGCANALGSHYGIIDHTKLSLFHILYIVQNGKIDGRMLTTTSSETLTGMLNSKGMNLSEVGTTARKVLGMEGNGVSEVIDGIIYDSNGRLKLCQDGYYNETADNYTFCGKTYAASNGYMSNVVYINDGLGVVPANWSGASDNYFKCPTFTKVTNTIERAMASNIFDARFDISATTESTDLTSRLCFMN